MKRMVERMNEGIISRDEKTVALIIEEYTTKR